MERLSFQGVARAAGTENGKRIDFVKTMENLPTPLEELAAHVTGVVAAIARAEVAAGCRRGRGRSGACRTAFPYLTRPDRVLPKPIESPAALGSGCH